MNEGLKFLYDEILAKKKTFHTCLIGSYELYYMDMQHIYFNWDKYKESSVVTIRRDRIAINMKNGNMAFEEYKL